MTEKPWLFRTYAGHSTAAASNALYRTNLAKGQTGLSVAFDLPTQTGYDPDHPLARGEVGKVGVPVAHLGHMRTLLDGIRPYFEKAPLAALALAPRGELALVGAYVPGTQIGSDSTFLMSGGRVIRGVVEGSADPSQFIPELIDYYRAGRFPFVRLIELFDFADIADAGADARAAGQA